MKRKYRIKRKLYYYLDQDPDTREYEEVEFYSYSVQMKVLPFIWLTIKKFYTEEKETDGEWWAKAQAENLLDELNKEQ